MYLEKLEIFGFKSFAKKTTLIFPPGITCVVGPNGCGKSNLVDAIRWILGEQSLKNLRTEKNEDLIFSAGKKRLNFSQGDIYLKDNKEGTLQDIKITRKFFRNGENEYFINGSKVKKEDLSLFLAQINFGQKSYSIIGQGMVDWILYSSKQERKEFFDEATGVKEYEIKKARAQAKIKKGLENLAQAEIAMGEVEPRVRSLSRQIKKWERRQEIEKKLITCEKDYYGARIFRLKREKEEIDKQIKEKREILEKEEKIWRVLQEKLKKITSDEPGKEFKELQKNWQEISEKRNKLLEKKASLKAEIFRKERTEKKTEQIDLSEIRHSLNELAGWQEKLVEKLKNFEEEKIEEIKKIAENISNKIKDILSLFSKPETSVQKDAEDLKKTEKEIEKLDDELKFLEEKLDKFMNLENEKRKEMAEIQRELQEEQEKISSLNYKLREMEMEKVKIETREEDIINEILKEAHFKEISSLSKIDLNYEEEQNLFSSIQRLKKEMELIGSFDEGLLKEYQECKEKYDFLFSQINDLKKSLSSLEEIKEKLERKIKDEFFSNFNKINENFEKYFKFLFKGGRAKLVLEEEKRIIENEEEDKKTDKEIKYGVEIYAKPPGKKIKSVQSLSGGEKALTSLALIFAILKTQSPPFIVLDEVDAALDEANSIRFSEIMKELSKKIQFVVITHNSIVMEAAAALYGVTIDKEGASHLVSLKLESF